MRSENAAPEIAQRRRRRRKKGRGKERATIVSFFPPSRMRQVSIYLFWGVVSTQSVFPGRHGTLSQAPARFTEAGEKGGMPSFCATPKGSRRTGKVQHVAKPWKKPKLSTFLLALPALRSRFAGRESVNPRKCWQPPPPRIYPLSFTDRALLLEVKKKKKALFWSTWQSSPLPSSA